MYHIPNLIIHTANDSQHTTANKMRINSAPPSERMNHFKEYTHTAAEPLNSRASERAPGANLMSAARIIRNINRHEIAH
jgi:hypothetical protein